MTIKRIGPSTNSKTKTIRKDVPAMGEVASFRYNNPGAQYPSVEAAAFGQIGYGVIGGNHLIAHFPSPVNGAAANFDLLHRNYTGMTFHAVGKKWTGSHSVGVPGYSPSDLLTKTMVNDAEIAIPLLKAIAHRESGKGNNLSELQWKQAHQMYRLGSADKFLEELGKKPDFASEPGNAETDGAALVRLARVHVGEEYKNVLVPKDDSTWTGPWDCAEFLSWLVFQHKGILYGCVDNNVPPKTADAYTGAWKKDMLKRGIKVSVEEAARTVGGVLLRYPPAEGKMGHIALCDGSGGTIEAKSKRAGVVADTVDGRTWHTGLLLPEFTYAEGAALEIHRPAFIYRIGEANMSSTIVHRIQSALKSRGYDPGILDGDYGPNTEAAVIAFQEAMGMVVDGEVGAETAAGLGISLDLSGVALPQAAVDPIIVPKSEVPGSPEAQDAGSAPTDLIATIVSLLMKDKKMTDGPLIGSKDAKNAALLALLQAISTGKTTDTDDLLKALVPQGGAAPSDPRMILLLILLRKLLGPEVGDGKSDIGPVNNALGKRIGGLLNGYKSTIGIVGSVLTGILGNSSGGGFLNTIATSIPALAGSSNLFLPAFLGMTAWGFLGKLEKWNLR